MEDEGLKDASDPWWRFALYGEIFNKQQLEQISFELWDLADETMSALRQRTTKTRGLPNISFIIRKPKPLGTELKDTICKKVGRATKSLELQKGKIPMRQRKYCSGMGATVACTLWMCKVGRQDMA